MQTTPTIHTTRESQVNFLAENTDFISNEVLATIDDKRISELYLYLNSDEPKYCNARGCDKQITDEIDLQFWTIGETVCKTCEDWQRIYESLGYIKEPA